MIRSSCEPLNAVIAALKKIKHFSESQFQTDCVYNKGAFYQHIKLVLV